MRVFITGVAGLIGSTLAKFYLKKGYEVTGADNFIGGYESNIPKTVHLYKLDILDTNRLVGNTKYTPPYDIFIHCAALAHEGLSVFSPSLINLVMISLAKPSWSLSRRAWAKLSFRLIRF